MNRIHTPKVLTALLLTLAHAPVKAADGLFPFPDGFYCDPTVSTNDPIVLIRYPTIAYPLSDFKCTVTYFTRADKGYIVNQDCGISEIKPDTHREEHWELSPSKNVVHIDGDRLERCKK